MTRDEERRCLVSRVRRAQQYPVPNTWYMAETAVKYRRCVRLATAFNACILRTATSAQLLAGR